MKVVIHGSSEEIAALIVALQERQIENSLNAGLLTTCLQQFLTEERKRDHLHT